MAVGLAITAPVIIQFDLHPLSALAVIGSTAPDWDYYIGIQHRTFTHSLLAMVLSSSLIWYFINIEYALIWLLCYLSHLLIDSLTVMGVPFLYPFIKTRQGIRKFRTGEGEDYFIQLIAIYMLTLTFT